jgi:hypothetical protein
VRAHGLSLAFGALFLATLVGQALVGHADFNAVQLAHNSDPITLWRYVSSSEFGVDVLENWQSEYLQFSLFILGTAHARPDSPAWARVGGWRTRLYSNSCCW